MIIGNTIKLCCLVGMSGSGKSTIAAEYAKRYCPELKEPIVVSYTTRPRRIGETQNCDHKFVSSDVVSEYKPLMVAYTKIGDYEYWATVDDVKQAFFYIIDPNGIVSLIKRCQKLGYQTDFDIVYVEVPDRMRLARLRARGDSDITIWNRLVAERAQFDTFRSQSEIPYQVLSNTKNLDETVKQLHRILTQNNE